MKPKNKFQTEAVLLHSKLPALTKSQIAHAYEKLFGFFVWKSKHQAVCFECGHRWHEETTLSTKLLGVDCPSCGKNLKLVETTRYSQFGTSKKVVSMGIRQEEIAYFQIITTFRGHQVIRIFQVKHRCKKGEKAIYSCMEIIQHWINVKGKVAILSCGSGSGMFTHSYNINWYGGAMENRSNSKKYFYDNAYIFPGRRVLPIMKRNGYKGHFYDFRPIYFFQTILTCQKSETLLKAGQIELFKSYSHSYTAEKIDRYWPQVKMCIRNKFIIKDTSIWLDYLQLLEYFRKDIFNPKFICPDDLHEEHNRLVKKKQKIQMRQKMKEMKAQIAKDNKVYVKEKKKYFGLKFSNDVIDIVFLDNVNEVFLEGMEHGHCVHTNGYFRRKDSLLFSSRLKDGTRLETIEFSLHSMAISQCRGAGNKDSKYHKEIVSLFTANIDKIKAIYTAKPKQKKKPVKAIMLQAVA